MKKTTLVAFLLFATQLIYSQQTISTAGGEASGIGGSSSYSVGQLMYNTNTGSGTVSQGVQHGIELFTLSNPELPTVNLSLATYPNPTSDYVILAIKNTSLTNLNYSLYDELGRVLTKGSAVQGDTQIDLQDFSTGVYILKISQANRELKTFKIIKK